MYTQSGEPVKTQKLRKSIRATLALDILDARMNTLTLRHAHTVPGILARQDA